MMKKPMIAILTLCLLFSVSAIVATSDAATVFGGSKIMSVDQDQRTITFKTKEGQTWTLPVADPNVLNKQPTIAKGDDVTIEPWQDGDNDNHTGMDKKDAKDSYSKPGGEPGVRPRLGEAAGIEVTRPAVAGNEPVIGRCVGAGVVQGVRGAAVEVGVERPGAGDLAASRVKILEGARAGIPARHFAEALKAVMDAYPVRTAEFQQLLPAAALSSADLRVALTLEGRTTTREFLDARQKDLKEALSLTWFLSLVGAVSFHDEPAAGDDVYGKTPVRRKKALPTDRAEALRQAALQILPGTYFHALGLDIAADAAEAERAYHEVATRFHPDGFAEYDAGDLADLLAAVQDKVTAAYRVLSNDEKRRAYLSFLVLKLELTGARKAGIDVDAEIALKKGERALLLHRNAEAVTALARAVERNPKEPEYHAMLGFAELHDPVLPRSQRAAEARKCARKALQLDPEHARAIAVLALAEATAGDAAEARKVVVAGLRTHPENEVLKAVLHRLNRAP